MADEDIHPSEWKWANTNDKFDEIIYNDSTLLELRHQVLSHLGAIPY